MSKKKKKKYDYLEGLPSSTKQFVLSHCGPNGTNMYQSVMDFIRANGLDNRPEKLWNDYLSKYRAEYNIKAGQGVFVLQLFHFCFNRLEKLQRETIAVRRIVHGSNTSSDTSTPPLPPPQVSVSSGSASGGLQPWTVYVTLDERKHLEKVLVEMRRFSGAAGLQDNGQKTEPLQKLTACQKNALQMMRDGESIFLTGGAGTGKTYIINRFLREKKNGVLRFAPTGKAAINLDGVTLHSFFRAPIGIIDQGMYLSERDDLARHIGDNNANVLKTAETIIIDEISMCRSDLFEYVMSVIHAAAAKRRRRYQIILVGDFYQLPPVVPNNRSNTGEREAWEHCQPENLSGWAFKSPYWAGVKMVVLDEVVRQKDKDFSTALNRVRVGDNSGLSWIISHCMKGEPRGNYITIASTNAAVKEANDKKLRELKNKKQIYKMFLPPYTDEGRANRVEKNDWMGVCEEILELCAGARVMCLCNNSVHEQEDDDNTNKQKRIRESFYNGETGTVKEVRKDSVVVALDRGVEIEITSHKWFIYGYKIKDNKIERITIGEFKQIPLRLAWASTVHKAQGMTYSIPVMIKSTPAFFAEGMTYVALSRATDVKNLYVEGNPKILTSQDVQKFYTSAK